MSLHHCKLIVVASSLAILLPLADAGKLPAVRKKIRKIEAGRLYKEGIYTLEHNGCKFAWEMRQRKGGQTLYLTVRLPSEDRCRWTFARQIPIHNKILTVLFQDWDKKRCASLTLGAFLRIEPRGQWNLPIAIKSSKSKEWRDYRRHYPNHRSQRSTNEMFLDFAHDTKADQALVDLFAKHGLSIKLKHVEKVFTQKAGKLPFFDGLKKKNIKRDMRVIYDAGLMHYKVTPIATQKAPSATEM